jgi:hypothetical protein
LIARLVLSSLLIDDDLTQLSSGVRIQASVLDEPVELAEMSVLLPAEVASSDDTSVLGDFVLDLGAGHTGATEHVHRANLAHRLAAWLGLGQGEPDPQHPGPAAVLSESVAKLVLGASPFAQSEACGHHAGLDGRQ